MAKLGDRVTFTVPLLHHVETIKDGKTLKGSIYSADQAVFAGIVGRVYEAPAPAEGNHEDDIATGHKHDRHHSRGGKNELHDLFLLIPNKSGQWVAGVREGSEAGEFKVA